MLIKGSIFGRNTYRTYCGVQIVGYDKAHLLLMGLSVFKRPVQKVNISMSVTEVDEQVTFISDGFIAKCLSKRDVQFMQKSQSVLSFWFEELKPEQWYKKDPALDQQIIERFGELHGRAVAGELFSWRTTPEGRVAELIVIDQFSRNMFRDSPKSFAFDGIALVLAQEAVSTGALDHLSEFQKNLILLPYMHSESRLVHEEAIKLRKRYGLDLLWEQKHKDIIDRFGRYPHRNDVLGRVSTPEEVEFLKQPGSSF